VNVYSEVGQGTTFRIYLPRVAGTVESISPQPAANVGRGGHETILLVEDDTKLREAIRAALSHLGYAILEAPNGADALEIWQESRQEIHLLLTDLVMPGGMTGKELAQRILQERPNLKVIYMSGHSADVVGKDLPMTEGVNFLAKPFQADRLAHAVRDFLDQR
jgi:DNA-binding NtrC family response regulator